MCANLYEILYRKMTISQDPHAANDQSGSEATGEGTRSKVVRPIAGPSLSPTALHGPRPFEPAKSNSTYTIFIASLLKERIRRWYSGRSSGDWGLGEFGPKANVK